MTIYKNIKKQVVRDKNHRRAAVVTVSSEPYNLSHEQTNDSKSHRKFVVAKTQG